MQFKTRNEYVTWCKRKNEIDLSILSGYYRVKYIRDENLNPLGVMLAYIDIDGHIRVGYSFKHSKEVRYDKPIGLRKAIDRAINYLTATETARIPSRYLGIVNDFIIDATDRLTKRNANAASATD